MAIAVETDHDVLAEVTAEVQRLQAELDALKYRLLRLSAKKPLPEGKLTMSDIYGIWAGEPCPTEEDHLEFKRAWARNVERRMAWLDEEEK